MANLTLSVFKKRVSEGMYADKANALRAVGKSALSKKDKAAAHTYVSKVLTPPMARTSTASEFSKKLRAGVYPTQGNAMAVIARSSNSAKVKDQLRAEARRFFETPKGKELQQAVVKRQVASRKKNAKAAPAPTKRHEVPSAPQQFVETLLGLDEKRTREMVILMSGAADFGFTLPSFIETLEKKIA
jgi:hypothetical protein